MITLMKRNLALLPLASILILAVLTESSFANAELESLAELSGFSEVPQIFSEALGTAMIKGNGTILNYRINMTGIGQVTGATFTKEKKQRTVISLSHFSELMHQRARILVFWREP